MMSQQELRSMDRAELERLFGVMRRELLEIRDEIDRRDREMPRRGVDVDFTEYVKDWK